jgi:tetratricopeptide (TPR) repeat protein
MRMYPVVSSTRGGRRFACALIMFCTFPFVDALADTTGSGRATDSLLTCRPIDNAPLNDYRRRDSMKWNIEDVKKNHLDPAMAKMNTGDFSEGVLSDVKFILNWYPNHYPALEALIRYDLGGGKFYEYNNTECYLDRARKFAPDDPNVSLYEGYYFWKKGNTARAIGAYKDALELDPKSADAHYNIGLLYVQIGNFKEANAHAHAAYSLGYPLPGLRRKLEKAGHWNDDVTLAQ